MADMVWFQSSGKFKLVGIPIETVNRCIDKYNNEPDNFRMKQDRGMLPWSFIPYLNWELFWEQGTDYHLSNWDLFIDDSILQQLHPFRIREA